MKLRKYQQSIFEKVVNSDENLLVQLDTGAGKTPIIAALAKHYESTIIVCHRNNLIKQASENLALYKINHNIIASKEIKKISALNNFDLTGKYYVVNDSHVIILSIDTFLSQLKRNKISFDINKTLILIDEAHHTANKNKWQKLIDLAKTRYVGLTATPVRGDGAPLIKQFDGVFDRIIQADGYEENATEKLISQGYLSQYRIFAAVTYLSDPAYSNSNELVLGDDVVSTYKKYMHKKKTLVVTSRILTAVKICEHFKVNGIYAEMVFGDMKTNEIDNILSDFKNNKIDVLISVDILNEGFNVPDANGLILVRKCGSFGMYRQYCGRVLRPGGEAVIVDLTGHNVFKYGLPSDHVDWHKKQEKGLYVNEVVICVKCNCAFKKYLHACPSCGETLEIARAGLSVFGYQKMDVDPSAYIEEKRRNYLQKQEQERLIKEKELEKIREFNEEYKTSYHVKFTTNLVGKRLNTFFDKLISYIKNNDSVFNFNLYVSCYQSQFDKIEFYTQVDSSQWNKNIDRAVELLYKKTKNDIHKTDQFEYYKKYQR